MSSILDCPIHKPNITMELKKIEKQPTPIIEKFEGVDKKNSRIIFLILLILIAIIYLNS